MSSNYIHKDGYEPKKENPNDFFPTPLPLCTKALQELTPPLFPLPSENTRVMDTGIGEGNWGLAAREIWPRCQLIGVELPKVNYQMQSNPYNRLIRKDYRDLTLEDVDGRLLDIVIGNPPYSTSQGKRDMLLAQKFVEKSLSLLKPNGLLMYFLRIDFLAGAHRESTLFKQNPPYAVHICAERVNFFPDRGDGQTHNHAVFVWRNRYPVYDRKYPTLLSFWRWRDEVA